MPAWTPSEMPLLHGRTAVVTGTGGIGFHVARQLARAGARVILAGRNRAKGESALALIRQDGAPAANVSFEVLDLASLRSIRAFGERLPDVILRLDLLINNAGVMTPPRRQVTDDGFELQFGTNHLGHFALTAAMMPLLRRGIEPRVVTLSSVAARQGVIDFENLQGQRHYRPMTAYSQSKLACLMFALELQRRSDAGGWGLLSMAAHPGISRTDLLLNGPGPSSVPGMLRRFMWFLFQPADQGALPALYAATSLSAQGGRYYGPDGWKELRGGPAEAAIPTPALRRDLAVQLWDVSEQLTAAVFPAITRPDRCPHPSRARVPGTPSGLQQAR